MIPASLMAPINYEAFYASTESPETQRFRALSAMIHRLQEAAWLSEGVHSVHLIDWDWRSENHKYNHRHVPMMYLSPEIYDWYREYGAFLQLAPERAQRFSFARFFFEVTPRRDIIVVRFDLTGDSLFSIRRTGRPRAAGKAELGHGASFLPDTVEIRMNISESARLCRPLAGLLDAFREKCPAPRRPALGEMISLADTISDLEEPVSHMLRQSGAAKRAGEAYVALPEKPLDQMGLGVDVLLHGAEPLDSEKPRHVTEQDVRVLLANLVVHAFLLPETLRSSHIAIVPGIAQMRDDSPMVSGGFLLHYDPPWPAAELDDWLVVATAWAREKAAFDLVERSRRQQLGRFIHNISNRFGGLIARARALQPPDKARAVAYEMEDMQGFMLAATAWVRGRAKNTDHVSGCPADALPELVEEVLASLAGSEDVLNNLFGLHVEYEAALASIRGAVDQRVMPSELHKVRMAFSRRLARELLGELIKNGLEYTPWAAAGSRVEVSFGSDEAGLYVEVANPVAPESLPHLERISEALRRKRDPEVMGLGIKAITMLCANEGLPWPVIRIDADRPHIVLRCHLARPWDSQAAPAPRNSNPCMPPGDL